MSTKTVRQKRYVITLACIFSVCTILCAPQLAHAGYLDPGSGSTAVQWIIAGIVATGKLKRRIFDTISRIFGR